MARMLVEERRQHIQALLQRDGRVLVSELSESLGISAITIRKDLTELESRGLAQRTHGGALTPQKSTILDLAFREKDHLQASKKNQ